MLWCYITIIKVIRLTHFKRESIYNNLRWNTHNGKDLNIKILYMYRNGATPLKERRVWWKSGKAMGAAPQHTTQTFEGPGNLHQQFGGGRPQAHIIES